MNQVFSMATWNLILPFLLFAGKSVAGEYTCYDGTYCMGADHCESDALFLSDAEITALCDKDPKCTGTLFFDQYSFGYMCYVSAYSLQYDYEVTMVGWKLCAKTAYVNKDGNNEDLNNQCGNIEDGNNEDGNIEDGNNGKSVAGEYKCFAGKYCPADSNSDHIVASDDELTALCDEDPKCTGTEFIDGQNFGYLCYVSAYSLQAFPTTLDGYTLCGKTAYVNEDGNNGDGNNGNEETDRYDDYVCYPQVFCPVELSSDAIFESESEIIDQCFADPKCTGVDYYTGESYNFGYFCYQTVYSDTTTAILESHKLCGKVAYVDGNEATEGDKEEKKENDETDEKEKEKEEEKKKEEEEKDEEDENDEKEDENDEKEEEEKEKEEEENKDEDDDETLDYAVIVNTKKSKVSCKVENKCIISYEANYENGKKGKKDSFDSVKICKLVDGERKYCKKATYKKNSFRLRLGDKKSTPSSATGEWICIVTDKGKEYISEPSVTVTVK